MSDRLDLLALNWQVTITRATGQTATFTRLQTLAKSKQGVQGPTGPAGLDNQDFPFLADSRDALRAANKGAGMYVVNDFIGRYSGGTSGDFDMFLAPNEFRFGSSAQTGNNSRLEYSRTAGKLRGIGSDGETEQWYASVDDGAISAGAGAVRLDANG